MLFYLLISPLQPAASVTPTTHNTQPPIYNLDQTSLYHSWPRPLTRSLTPVLARLLTPLLATRRANLGRPPGGAVGLAVRLQHRHHRPDLVVRETGGRPDVAKRTLGKRGGRGRAGVVSWPKCSGGHRLTKGLVGREGGQTNRFSQRADDRIATRSRHAIHLSDLADSGPRLVIPDTDDRLVEAVLAVHASQERVSLMDGWMDGWREGWG